MGGMTLEELRQELPVTRRVGYFQTGTYGPTPTSVLAAVRDAMEYEATRGPTSPDVREELGAREEAARTSLAALLNVGTDELGIGTNTTRSMQRVLRNIDWRPGDELVISSLEHVSTVNASTALQQERGVAVKVVEADDEDDAAFLEGLEGTITERTRLVCLSHVASPNGRIMPVAEAAALAHEKGLPVVVDAAQSIGQFPVDVPSLGCDYLVGSGPKWLLGPTGTGFVWVAPDHIGDFRPDFTPDSGAWSKPDDSVPAPTTRSRAELGTYNHGLVVGLGRAASIISYIGPAVIRDHVARLSGILREAMADHAGVRVLTPTEPGRSAGVTTLTFEGYGEPDLQALVAWLHDERKILVKAQWLTAPLQLDLIGMRISIAGFNTEEEVRHLVRSLQEGLSKVWRG